MPFPGIETFPGSKVFPGEEGTPQEFSELGDMLYAALAPTWTGPDEKLGFPLRTFCDVLMAQGQGLRDQVKEVGDRPGYGVLMIPDECPAEALPFLAQLAGVDLNQLHRGVIVVERNDAPNPSFEHDAIGSTTPFGWEKEFPFEVTFEKYEVGNGWSGPGGSRALHLKIKRNGKSNPSRVGVAAFNNSTSMVPVKEGKTCTVQALLNIVKAPPSGFDIDVQWYKADAKTVLFGSGTTGKKLVGLSGEQILNRQIEVPPGAAFGQFCIIYSSEAANEVVEFWVDNVVVTVENLPPTLPITYIDGDTAGCSWTGLPGKSASVQSREETEEEFVATQRKRIKELQNSSRGTPASILRAAEEYLIGDKTVILTERVGGSPWRLSVITFLEETPNVQLVKESIENFLPAGIILEYEAVPETTWSLIRGEYTTWNDVRNAFATWDGVRDNLPGT